MRFFSVCTDKTPRNKEVGDSNDKVMHRFFKDANQEIDSLEAFTLRNYPRIVVAINYKQVKKGLRQKKLVALIGVEGSHMIEDDLANLDSLYSRGMRYMTLTWNNSTSWASSTMNETLSPLSFGDGQRMRPKGLTDFGKQVIKRMNELGVIVDLSHVGEQTFYDALETITKPVLLSHSFVWHICPVFRNVKDDQIKAVEKRGVICINFFPALLIQILQRKWMSWLAMKGST